MTERPAYPSDLSDARWALIAPRLTAWRQARTDAGVGGRTASHDLREILNAILYVNRTGIAWRYLPHDLPPWQTVYGYYTAWTQEGIFAELNYQLTGLVRDRTGRHPQPGAAIMDSQSVKTSTNAPPATCSTTPPPTPPRPRRGSMPVQDPPRQTPHRRNRPARETPKPA